MPRLACLALAAVFAALPASAQPPLDKPLPGELKRARVLLVADTDGDLADSVKADLRRVWSLFAKNVPESRREVTALDGKRVTRDNILAHFRKMKGLRDEAVVFYFAGHEALDGKRGHYMQMQPADGPPLLRPDLRRAMEGTGAGLVVLLTDCCSNKVDLPPIPPPKDDKIKKDLTPMHPTMRQLFFASRGVVDITGAQIGAGSWGDDEQGGVFTRVCCRLLSGPARDLDADRDGKVTWDEAFVYLRVGTAAEFRRWKAAIPLDARGRIKQTSQVPHSFLIRGAAPPIKKG